MPEPVFHVKISKAKADPYAAPKSEINTPCGCEVQPCGFVVAKETCQYHSEKRPQSKNKMFAHLASNCLG